MAVIWITQDGVESFEKERHSKNIWNFLCWTDDAEDIALILAGDGNYGLGDISHKCLHDCAKSHGVEIPARADCVKGRRMATVPKAKFDLEICGGTFVDEPCVIDGNLISGRTFWDHGHYMGPWMKLLDEARDAQS